MYPFPLPALQATSADNPITYVVFLVIGFFFGYILESAGFGNSKKLAAQFYFRDLTVLKVMFGAIVTAMVLMFTMIGLGILDYNLVWVNPTYLSSGIVGGLIMGVGFIIGGFCPGTSLAAMATGKIDGMFFVGGGLVGIFIFGEVEKFFDSWWQNSGYLGRFTLMDWLHLPTGVVVTIVVLMALFMFWGGEQLERLIGKRDIKQEPKWRYGLGAALLAMAVVTIIIGTPSTDQKWAKVAAVKETALADRQVQISPAELYTTMFDNKLVTVMIDVRSEADYNLYHINGAVNVPQPQVESVIPKLLAQYSPHTVYVVMSNDEEAATTAWKTLVANSVTNVYILDGGVNNWIAFFGKDDPEIQPVTNNVGVDQLRYTFPSVLGSRYKSCYPDPQENESLKYDAKIKLELKRDKSGGGCG
ncbi:MAG: YeeE/YedE thiosulfate transporter family protein [Anaerolineae bacterium]